MHDLQLKLLDLLLEQGDLKRGVVLNVGFCLRLQLRREDAVDHALWTHYRLLLELLNRVAVPR